MHLHTMTILVIIISVLSCSKAVDVEQEKEALIQTDHDFAKTSVEQGAAEAFRKYLAPDALQFATGFKPIRGNQKIYEKMRAGMDSAVVLDWKPMEAAVARSGDMGYTWGTYTVYQQDMVSGKRQPVDEGKYVNVWRKSTEGSWKVIIDIGNSNNEE